MHVNGALVTVGVPNAAENSGAADVHVPGVGHGHRARAGLGQAHVASDGVPTIEIIAVARPE